MLSAAASGIPRLRWAAPPRHTLARTQWLLLSSSPTGTPAAAAAGPGGLEPPDLPRLAKSARISLSPEEAEEFAPKIQQVVDWFGQLQAVDLECVEPSLRAAGNQVGGAWGSVQMAVERGSTRPWSHRTDRAFFDRFCVCSLDYWFGQNILPSSTYFSFALKTTILLTSVAFVVQNIRSTFLSELSKFLEASLSICVCGTFVLSAHHILLLFKLAICFTGTAAGSSLREDKPEPFANRDAIIEALPSYDDPYIKVPRVLNKE